MLPSKVTANRQSSAAMSRAMLPSTVVFQATEKPSRAIEIDSDELLPGRRIQTRPGLDQGLTSAAVLWLPSSFLSSARPWSSLPFLSTFFFFLDLGRLAFQGGQRPLEQGENAPRCRRRRDSRPRRDIFRCLMAKTPPPLKNRSPATTTSWPPPRLPFSAS